MANEQYLDYVGLQRLVAKVLSAIATNGSYKVDKSATGINGTGTVQNNGTAIQLQMADGTYHTCYLHIGHNNILLDVQNNDESDIGDSADPYGHMMFEITANDITFRRDGETPTSIIDKLDFDNSPTQYSDAAITSGGVYNALLNVIGIAEGKTANVVISDAEITGYVNDEFNSTNATITLTISGNKVVDVNNVNHDLSSFKVGDIISITNVNVPDRWVGSISGGNIVFYPLETKLNIDVTPTANSTNPVSSGGVYQALQGKQNSMTAISNDEIDALF